MTAPSELLSRRERVMLFLQREVSRFTPFFWIPASTFTMRYLLCYRIQNASRPRRRYPAMGP